MKFYIIHGAFGNPEENWFPWLKSELEKLNHQVIIPKFPTPEEQNLDNWLKVMENYQIEKDDIIIGHSLGCAFILKLLEKIKVKTAFLVAGFISKLNIEKFDEINKTFIENFNFNKIKNNCEKFHIFQSINDPYVPMKKAEELSKKLNEGIIKIDNAGHFNKESGFIKFNNLLEIITNFYHK